MSTNATPLSQHDRIEVLYAQNAPTHSRRPGTNRILMAAMESQKSAVGVLRERVADRRGRNIGSVATARRELELVFYALRDGHVRALEHLPAAA